jgi:CDP-diacylglycerol--glycerol-3-phosphate 3-phosphatidyltransferase
VASIYDLKPGFQRLLRPLLHRLAAARVTPNQITVAALVLSTGIGGVIAWQPDVGWPLLLLPAALLVRMALNALDGMMARELDMQSHAGVFLNELGDVLSDSVLYLPLTLVPGVEPALMVSVVVLAALSEMAGVVALQVGATRRYDGPMGKSDRALVFGLVGLVLGLGVGAGRWVTGILSLVAALLVVTTVRRARRAIQEVTP